MPSDHFESLEQALLGWFDADESDLPADLRQRVATALLPLHWAMLSPEQRRSVAAHRAGIKRIVLPERCRKDMVDVPEQAKKELEFHFVTRMDEVLNLTLESSPWKTPPPAEEPKPAEVRA